MSGKKIKHVSILHISFPWLKYVEDLPGLVSEMDQLLAQINILKQKTKEIS
jgi:hypothetical protein